MGGGLLRKAGKQVAEFLDAQKKQAAILAKSSVAVSHSSAQLRGGSSPSSSHNPTPAPSTTTANATHDFGDWHAPEHKTVDVFYVEAWLFEMKNDDWRHETAPSFDVLKASSYTAEKQGRFRVDATESAKLMEIPLEAEPMGSVLVFTTDSPTPLPLAVELHSLGFLGPWQV
jgi:hypothetical protein